MIRGLPYVEAQRRLGSSEFLACGHCKSNFTLEQRRHMRCGWIARSQWKEPLQDRPLQGIGELPEVCPGYAQYDPRVIEVYTAHSWWSKGSLTVRFPEPTEMLMVLIDLANGAIAGANDYYLSALKDKAK